MDIGMRVCGRHERSCTKLPHTTTMTRREYICGAEITCGALSDTPRCNSHLLLVAPPSAIRPSNTSLLPVESVVGWLRGCHSWGMLERRVTVPQLFCRSPGVHGTLPTEEHHCGVTATLIAKFGDLEKRKKSLLYSIVWIDIRSTEDTCLSSTSGLGSLPLP